MGDMAVTFIDEPVAGQHIESGDLIYSPIFDRPTNDPNCEVRFVLLGELPGRSPREVAKRIVTRRGGILDSKVSVRTDFILFGERESEVVNSQIQMVELDVIALCSFALGLVAELRVHHESPQALLFKNGTLSWHRSHDAITEEALNSALASS
jgi:hypothetical protein